MKKISLIIILLIILISSFVLFLFNFSKQDQSNKAIINNLEKNKNMFIQKEEDIKLIQKVTLKTNFGEIELELYPEKAPITVENFVKLGNDNFYDGTRFHRVIEDFMIQGGDPLSKDSSQIAFWGTGGPDYKFDDEINDIKLVQSVIAMANAGPNTNGSQFFIITAEETPWLQGQHTGFGKVVNGMDVVMQIQQVEVEPQTSRPINDVILEEVIIGELIDLGK